MLQLIMIFSTSKTNNYIMIGYMFYLSYDILNQFVKKDDDSFEMVKNCFNHYPKGGPIMCKIWYIIQIMKKQ